MGKVQERSRFACIAVDNFPLASLYRVEPELCGQPVVITDGQGPRAEVLCVSAEAARLGVCAGLSATQALAVCSRIVLRPLRTDNLRAAENALADVARSFSPRVEKAGAGVVFLEAGGSMAMYGSEEQLMAALAARGRRVGLALRVGIGSSKVVARLAACVSEALAVPAGKEAIFLASLPVDLLEPSDEVARALGRWGIRTIGQLAALPPNQVVARLGREGSDLVRWARGEDTIPLCPAVAAEEFAEAVELEYAVESIEPLLFVLRAMLERLLARLELQALVAADLRLSFWLAGTRRGEAEERTICVVSPTNEARALLALLCLDLERKPPGAMVERLRLRVRPDRPRPVELGLFSPAGPAPRKLAATVAKLVAACGADRVGAPVVVDSHCPGRSRLERFLPAQAVVGEEPGQPEWAVNRLALRAIRPPAAVEVFCEREWPAFVRGRGMGGRVINTAGPWRVEGEWWRENSFGREYFDLELSDGCIYRMYRDLKSNQWFTDGVYD